MIKGNPKPRNISDGLADRELCISTPDLNQPAQAEPGWLPVWTVDGDDAEWRSTGEDDDGRWELSVEPHDQTLNGVPECTVWHHTFVCQSLWLTPDKARALRYALGEWLKALEVTR